MPITAHDLRYKAEESYPLLYAYLLRTAQRYLGSLKDDPTEVDLVIGYVVELLVRIGLLGGGNITPLTKLDKLGDAQFYVFLNRSVRNKAIDRLRKRKIFLEVNESEETLDTENDADFQGEDLKDIASTPPFTREEALELALQQALHTLREAYIGEGHIFTDSENGRQHKARIQVLEKQNEGTPSSSIVHIRIVEEPLTAQNFVTIISTLTELHTKCWLIARGHFADLIQYAQTHDTKFLEEANLVITRLSHNSPADIKLNVNADTSPQSIAEALKIGIDAVAHTPQRLRAAKLENESKELEIKQKELEAQTLLADKDHKRQIEAEKAEIEKQKSLLELEKQQVDLEKQRLELQRERLKMEIERVDYALETANKMINVLYPNADTPTKAMLLQTLLPNLLQLSNGKGLELVLPAPKDSNEETSR